MDLLAILDREIGHGDEPIRISGTLDHSDSQSRRQHLSGRYGQLEDFSAPRRADDRLVVEIPRQPLHTTVRLGQLETVLGFGSQLRLIQPGQLDCQFFQLSLQLLDGVEAHLMFCQELQPLELDFLLFQLEFRDGHLVIEEFLSSVGEFLIVGSEDLFLGQSLKIGQLLAEKLT